MKRSSLTNSLTDRLAALGEVVRLRMLRVLEREELSVGEVAKVVQLPQSTVSRHLKVLADGGWVAKRTEGTATYYRVVLDDLPVENRALWMAVREQLGGAGAGGAELAEDGRRLTAVLAERREDSQAFFGRVAGQWDDVRAELFGAKFTTAGMLAMLPREWTVIDLGCGTGNAAELLAPLVKRVIAVDRSQPMLSAAKKRLAGHGNVEFVLGDMTGVPLPAGKADAAVCFLVMHHVEDPAAAFTECARLLKPGGQMLVVDMVEHDRDNYRHTMGHRWLGFSRSQIEGMAREGGLGSARYVTLPGDTDARGPGLFAMTAFKE
jgi:ubiquinone/menaquinone biosynthesis C-methylase UbiE